MICICLIYFSLKCSNSPRVLNFIKNHIIADDPWDSRRPGPWGMRPEDPDDWNQF